MDNFFLKARKKSKHPLEKAAKELKITKTYLRMIENNQKVPSLSLATRMCTLYKVKSIPVPALIEICKAGDRLNA